MRAWWLRLLAPLAGASLVATVLASLAFPPTAESAPNLWNLTSCPSGTFTITPYPFAPKLYIEITGPSPCTFFFDAFGDVVVELPNGGNTVVLDDSTTPTNLTSLTIDGGSGSNSFDVDTTIPGVTTYIDRASSTSETVNILGTSATGPLSVSSTGTAPDTVNIGSAGSLRGVQGSVSLSSSDANAPDRVVLDDSADTTGRSATIGDTLVSGLAPGAINFTGSQLSSLTVKFGSGSDTANVTPSPSFPMHLDGGPPGPPAIPGDTLNMNLAGTTSPALATTFSSSSGYAGSWTFANRNPVAFSDFETLVPGPLAPTASITTPTTTTLSASPNPAVAGQEVTYVATVTPGVSGGTVTFRDDGTTIAGCVAVPLSGGSATCDPSYAAIGTHVIEASFSGTSLDAPSNTQLSEVVDLQAIYGEDPIGTAIAISQAEYPAQGSAKAVVLARSDFFSDALAGGPLAVAEGGPLLLTEGADQRPGLGGRTLAEIERVLRPGGTVFVLGGDLAVPASVDTTLAGLGYKVVREAGANEFATAVDIAGALGDPANVFEATGLDFPDALSAVPAAVANHGAILLTNGATQAPETAAYLAAHPYDVRFAIGGPLAAAGADPGAKAIYGTDAYGTSAAVASYFFPGARLFGVATGRSYTDALSGAVFMASGGRLGPVLLVDPAGSPTVPAPVASYLSTLEKATPGDVFGGPLAVPDALLEAIQAITG